MKRAVALAFSIAALGLGTLSCATEPFIEATYSPQTTYAAGFREDAFAAVTVGMSKVEVLRRVGKPLKAFTIQSITLLVYSEMGHATKPSERAFRLRQVAVDDSGMVVYVWRRTILIDGDRLLPVVGWKLDSNGVHQPVVLPPYAKPRV